MTLTPEHRAFLAAQAVDPDLAEKLGVRSLTSSADLEGMGEEWARWANFPAIAFPWMSPAGTPAKSGTVYQVRPDSPSEGLNGRPRKYVFPKDMTPVLWAVRPVEGATRIVIVEGTKQALSAATYAPPGVAVYGIAGCRMWQKDKAPIPDLAVAEGREVVVILDSDSATNPEVYRAGIELAEALELEGATGVLFIRIKGRDKDGLDDVLAAREEHRRAVWLARAIDQAKPKPADKPPKGKATVPTGALILPSPSNPMAVARVIEPDLMSGEAHTVRSWNGGWWRWETARWRQIEDLDFTRDLYARTEHARYLVQSAQGDRYEEWSPTEQKIRNLAAALAGITYLDRETEVPAWIVGEHGDLGTLVSCQNGLLRIANRELIAHDAGYFNLVAVPFDFQADAPEPVEWLRFLETLWPDGGEGQVAALQEWFGYVISGRTDFQKLFAITGPPRSGKGTIATVLVELIGKRNMAGPTLASFSQNFGLQTLIGKSLALVSDARVGHQTDTSVIVERLLSISGEDPLSVPRKNLTDWEGRLSARLMLLSNELPRLSDNSGAIATRWVVIETTESFLGREDLGLKDRLMAELPGILNWALDGLDRLLAQGRFTETEVGREAVEILTETSSPYAPFVTDECVKGPEYEVSLDAVWNAWVMWCFRNDKKNTGVKPRFGRDLKSVVPGMRLVRPRGEDGKQYRAYRGLGLKADYPAHGPASESRNPGGESRNRGGESRSEPRKTGEFSQVSDFESRRVAQNTSSSDGDMKGPEGEKKNLMSESGAQWGPTRLSATQPDFQAPDQGKHSESRSGPTRLSSPSQSCSASICGCGSCRWDSGAGRYVPAA